MAPSPVVRHKTGEQAFPESHPRVVQTTPFTEETHLTVRGNSNLDPEVAEYYEAEVNRLKNKIEELRAMIPKPVLDHGFRLTTFQVELSRASLTSHDRWFPWAKLRQFWPGKNPPFIARWDEITTHFAVSRSGAAEFVYWLILELEAEGAELNVRLRHEGKNITDTESVKQYLEDLIGV